MNNKPYFRLIGDCHGLHGQLAQISERAEYSLCVGDIGFNYDFFERINFDPVRHRMISGNHDNFSKNPEGKFFRQTPHFLGDFGIYSVPGFGDIFYVRGGWSIDYKFRQIGVNWWPDDEELSYEQCEKAIDLYKSLKPKFVVSHECPYNIVRFVADPLVAHSFGHPEVVIKTRTNQMLQAMVDFHAPRIHVFGHYHQNFDKFVNGKTGEVMPEHYPIDPEHTASYTRYICLAELQTMDFEKEDYTLI